MKARVVAHEGTCEAVQEGALRTCCIRCGMRVQEERTTCSTAAGALSKEAQGAPPGPGCASPRPGTQSDVQVEPENRRTKHDDDASPGATEYAFYAIFVDEARAEGAGTRRGRSGRR